MNRRTFFKVIGGVLASVGLSKFVQAEPEPKHTAIFGNGAGTPDEVWCWPVGLASIHSHNCVVAFDSGDGRGVQGYDSYTVIVEEDSEIPGMYKFVLAELRLEISHPSSVVILPNHTLLMVHRKPTEKFYRIHQIGDTDSIRKEMEDYQKGLQRYLDLHTGK